MNVLHVHVARAGVGANVAADIVNVQTAGAAGGFHGAGDAVNLFVA